MAKFKATQNKNLKNKYRFVVLNDETFEEKFSLVLTGTNAWVFLSTVVVALILITASAIIYTPLKYFIPGFGDYNYKSKIVALEFQADSIQRALYERSIWLSNYSDVLQGKIDTTVTKPAAGKINKDSLKITGMSEDMMDLRKEVEEEDNFSLSYKFDEKAQQINELKQMHFIAPVQGYITDDFNPQKEHFGIDIVTTKDAPVKSVLDGKVISTEWTLETGYVIAVQHSNNLVSFYKHNSKLLKKTGNFVSAGDVIAITGNSGELTTGPHLHFELWRDGNGVDPKQFITF
jgi:murein DD-endopeptidase MepM/ murein hydrolase activator NlpD